MKKTLINQGMRSVLAFTIVVIIVLAGCPTSVSYAQTPPKPDYAIKSANSHKCLNAGYDTAHGVHQATCDDSPNQSWRIIPAGRGGGSPYLIKSPETGLCLAVAGSSKINGGRVELVNCDSNQSIQRWKEVIYKGSLGWWMEIVSDFSGLCLDLANSSTNDAANIQQWQCVNVLNQMWSFPSSYIAAKYNDLGGSKSFLHQPVTEERRISGYSSSYRVYQGGVIYWNADTGPYEVHGAIYNKWSSLGLTNSFLGFPITDETSTPDGKGRFNHFQDGSIYWYPNIGAFEVHGAIQGKWAELGWEKGSLGYPITDETDAGDGGRFNNFQNGSIYWNSRTGVTVYSKHFGEQTCGGTISDGQTITQYNFPGWPHCDYFFQGRKGEQVTIEVTVLSGGLIPGILLFDPHSNIFAESKSDGLYSVTLNAGDGRYGFRIGSAVEPRTYGSFKVYFVKPVYTPGSPSLGMGPIPQVGGSQPGTGQPKPTSTRQSGDFHEVRTNISDGDFNKMPLARKCSTANKQVNISLTGTNQFQAVFYANGNPVNTAYNFSRYWFSADIWVGGANISDHKCTVGVVIDGRPGKPDYEVWYLNANTGQTLQPDGYNSYPKMNQQFGVLKVEPRIWFSPDDTVAMTIAASDDVSGSGNMIAHFIDLISGRTIALVEFKLPASSTIITPYNARIDVHQGHNQVVFQVDGKEIARNTIP